jgi:hypothetical protein
MNTAVIVKQFDFGSEIAVWANGLIGNYLPENCGLAGVIVNSIISVQVTPPTSNYGRWLAVLLVEVWCPETDKE